MKVHPLFAADVALYVLYVASICFFGGLFLSSAKAFLLALVVAAIAAGVAFSPAGEMAALHSLRARPATRREQDQLFAAADLLPDLAAALTDLKARIWVVDSPAINGCAVGRQSIVVTTGALRDPSACAASRAHELAADVQAARWGAGEHLVRLLESMPPTPTGMSPGWGWVWATHPAPAGRIDAIEREMERLGSQSPPPEAP